MALSTWRSYIVLPGEKASALVRGAKYSYVFSWTDPGIEDKISYFFTGDSKDAINNPKVGKNLNLIVNGYKNLVESDVEPLDIFVAIGKTPEPESSSSSSMSYSCSSSSQSKSSSCCSSSCSSSCSSCSCSSSSCSCSCSCSSESVSSQSMSSQSMSSNCSSNSSQSMSSQSMSSSCSSNSSQSTSSQSISSQSTSSGPFPGVGWYCLTRHVYLDNICNVEDTMHTYLMGAYYASNQEDYEAWNVDICQEDSETSSHKITATGPNLSGDDCFGYMCFEIWVGESCGELIRTPGSCVFVSNMADYLSLNIGVCYYGGDDPGYYYMNRIVDRWTNFEDCVSGCH